MTPTDYTKEVSVLCEQGDHGTPERRYVTDQDWSGMFTGKCAGSLYDGNTGQQYPCPCECHEEVQT